MDRRAIAGSSIIKSVGWEGGVLEVEFHPIGTLYHYYGVGIDLYHQMVAADSVGSFFKQEIEPNFSRQRIK